MNTADGEGDNTVGGAVATTSGFREQSAAGAAARKRGRRASVSAVTKEAVVNSVHPWYYRGRLEPCYPPTIPRSVPRTS